MFKKSKSGMVTSEEAHAEAERIGNAIIEASVTDLGNMGVRVIPYAISSGIAAAVSAIASHHGIDPVSVVEEALNLVRDGRPHGAKAN